MEMILSIEEEKGMDYIKNLLRDESGIGEAASSAVMVGMLSGLSGIWSGGLSGIWNNIINNHLAMILVGFVLIFVFWIVFKA